MKTKKKDYKQFSLINDEWYDTYPISEDDDISDIDLEVEHFIQQLNSGELYEEYYGTNNSEFLRISEYEHYHALKNLYDDDIDCYWFDVKEDWWE